MTELLQNPLLIIFGSLTITSVVSTAAYYWHKTQKAELEASLKLEMIQRGMSADEIERVLQATASGKSSMPNVAGIPLQTGTTRDTGPHPNPEAVRP
jgi:hypothetical protein